MLGKLPTNGPKSRATYKIPSPPVPSLSPVPADVQAFAASVLGGTFYESLAEQTGLDRSVVKRRVLIDIFAPRRLYDSFVLRAFSESYPSVLKAIRAVNRDDHATLIRQLQRLESWLVIEQIAPRLLAQRVPTISLHDAIFAQRRAVDIVADAFRETFDELEVHFALKTEGGFTLHNAEGVESENG